MPAIAVPVQPENLATLSINSTDLEARLQRSPLLSYDDILDLIEVVENDELDERCTSEQLEKVACFLSVLAKNSAPSRDPFGNVLLDEDIQTLMCEARMFQFLPHSYLDGFSIVTAVFHDNVGALLCKSWIQKQSHSLKKFVKKHKTAIIIGAAVVVAVTVAVVAVVALTGTAAASTAAATAGAAAGLASGEKSDRLSPNPPHLIEEPIVQHPPVDLVRTLDQVLPMRESPPLAQMIEEKTILFKETLTQEALAQPTTDIPNGRSFVETARDVGSFLAHEILDGAAALGSAIPQILNEIGDVRRDLFPESMEIPNFGEERPVDPVENYNETVLCLHDKIDKVFSTDFADSYTPEAKENRPDFAIGIIPLPGTLFVKNIGKHSILDSSTNVTLTRHALQRAAERCISEEAILEALETPLKIEEIRIDQLGRPSQRFIGKQAEVVLNPETKQIVSVNPTSTKKAEKLIIGIPANAED